MTWRQLFGVLTTAVGCFSLPVILAWSMEKLGDAEIERAWLRSAAEVAVVWAAVGVAAVSVYVGWWAGGASTAVVEKASASSGLMERYGGHEPGDLEVDDEWGVLRRRCLRCGEVIRGPYRSDSPDRCTEIAKEFVMTQPDHIVRLPDPIEAILINSGCRAGRSIAASTGSPEGEPPWIVRKIDDLTASAAIRVAEASIEVDVSAALVDLPSPKALSEILEEIRRRWPDHVVVTLVNGQPLGFLQPRKGLRPSPNAQKNNDVLTPEKFFQIYESVRQSAAASPPTPPPAPEPAQETVVGVTPPKSPEGRRIDRTVS